MTAPSFHLHHGDTVDVLPTLEPESIQCVVTSPPYWALRDYQNDPRAWPEITFTPITGAQAITVDAWSGCLGLEPTLELFVAHIVFVFRLLRPAMRPDGVVWLNMGDSYAGAPGGQQSKSAQCADRADATEAVRIVSRPPAVNGLGPKNLVGQPWRVAFALQADGWCLRQDIIWAKPAPMPESVSDRCTKAHEYLFLFSLRGDYYWDPEALREPVSGNAHARSRSRVPYGWGHGDQPRNPAELQLAGVHQKDAGITPKSAPARSGIKANESFHASISQLVIDRNRRSVWTIPAEPFKGSHFATYPKGLVRPCILAATRPGDVVLDPFAGSGTTGATALELGRSTVLIEKNAKYAEIIRDRCRVIGLALEGGGR